jgi:hypothetical protein
MSPLGPFWRARFPAEIKLHEEIEHVPEFGHVVATCEDLIEQLPDSVAHIKPLLLECTIALEAEHGRLRSALQFYAQRSHLQAAPRGALAIEDGRVARKALYIRE